MAEPSPPPPLPAQTPALRAAHGSDRRFGTVRSISALILREMATRYGRSPGGYLWALLEPMGMIVILSVAFAVVVRSPSLGNSFILYFATGFLPFSLFLNLSNMVGRGINFSRPLLAYPAVTWVDALMARFVLNTLTELLVMGILFTGILAFVDAQGALDLVPIVGGVALAALLGMGFGVFNAAMFGLFPVYERVWSIVTRPLFLLSGVLFLYENMPPLARDILWWNPLQHVTAMVRTGFYPTYGASFVQPAYAVGVGLVVLFLGVVLMGRYHREILNDY